MKEKLLFFDIDGTLIDCTKDIIGIPDTTRESLQKLQQQGHHPFLATGRCKCFIVDEVMSYPFDGYVTCNGGYVEYKGQEIFKEIVSIEALKVTHQFCKKHDIVYYFEANETIYTLRKDHPKHIEFKKQWKMKEEVIEDTFNIEEIETYIGMIVVNSKDEIEEMKQTLSPYFDIQRHHSEYSFDLTWKGVSKAVGIHKLVAVLNKDIEETIAFGDGRNDLEMLQTVGIGIAMGNAVPEAKNVSNYITTNIEEDGITAALKHFSLI